MYNIQRQNKPKRPLKSEQSGKQFNVLLYLGISICSKMFHLNFADKHLKDVAGDVEIIPGHSPRDDVRAGPHYAEQRGRLLAHDGVNVVFSLLAYVNILNTLQKQGSRINILKPYWTGKTLYNIEAPF